MAKAASNKNFGIVMSIFFALVTIYLKWKHQSEVNFILLGISAGFCFFAFFFSPILTPLNFLWTKLGILLHKITSPLILSFIYFGVFFPMGLIFKLFGKDPLHRKFQPEQASYWVTKSKADLPFSMKNQF